ncbi:hypothetical protein ACSFBF_07040 [Variovorax sp. ZT5P49]|uniref:hypothetical protein n=1 Tax=Variovorax sp. ZT5P49 TaxID=3443733 RepID=UPI003F449227
MRFTLAASLALLLCACATPTTGVVPLSDGLNKITHQGSAGFVRTEQLKTAAIQEADGYCARDRKRVRVIDVTQREARPLGGWPEAEVLFKCE